MTGIGLDPSQILSYPIEGLTSLENITLPPRPCGNYCLKPIIFEELNNGLLTCGGENLLNEYSRFCKFFDFETWVWESAPHMPDAFGPNSQAVYVRGKVVLHSTEGKKSLKSAKAPFFYSC